MMGGMHGYRATENYLKYNYNYFSGADMTESIRIPEKEDMDTEDIAAIFFTPQTIQHDIANTVLSLIFEKGQVKEATITEIMQEKGIKIPNWYNKVKPKLLKLGVIKRIDNSIALSDVFLQKLETIITNMRTLHSTRGILEVLANKGSSVRELAEIAVSIIFGDSSVEEKLEKLKEEGISERSLAIILVEKFGFKKIEELIYQYRS